ncbi:MAG TPA: serine/threonine-protein kinase [Polyangiaceae bacterium]|jgi:serine/threonine-protein kinase|nr:serine/threonine-protein kinase [Polyangiaceae bacterium]
MDQPNDPVAERARQRVGMTLKEKWRLDDLVGVGGMAAVYSATHRNGMRVAVKMLHAELSVDGEVRSRFLREGYLANKVDHPGAVAVLDDEVADDGAVFLVMELLEGETLAHRFERKARTLLIEEILLIADKVLDILAAAHDKHIVHRDIKPDNIFLTHAGSVKVLDFGIARLREMSPHLSPPKTSSTRSGSTMGTPAYMAPEQARARWDEVDGRTDLWSVGATMFKLLTGRVVHVADTINEQLLSAMTKPAPPLATLVPTVPIPVLEVVDKALQYTKEERWADARAMQRAIRDAYQAITGVSPTSVRLAFDDTETVAHADTVVLSTKVPTSLTAAHDSSAFPKKGGKPWAKIAWILTLCGVGVGGYSYLAQRNAAGVDAPLGEVDGGAPAAGPIDFTNPFASPDPSALPGSPSLDQPSRVETPPLEPETIDPAENAPPPPDSPAAPSRSVDEVPPPAPRAAISAAPVHPAAVTTPPKPVTTATHKPAPPPPRPPAPVKKPPPPPPPQPQRPFRRP